MSNFKLINGSCIDQEVDAIVNAANCYMTNGAGVAGAISSKAGPELAMYYRKCNLPIQDGEVLVTPSFNITNAKIIINAVGPDFGRTPDGFDILFNAYYNSLLALKDNNYHTISFPLISSGIFGGGLENPVRVSTSNCLKAYNKFINDYKDYDIDVRLCAYTIDEYKEAKQEIGE